MKLVASAGADLLGESPVKTYRKLTQSVHMPDVVYASILSVFPAPEIASQLQNCFSYFRFYLFTSVFIYLSFINNCHFLLISIACAPHSFSARHSVMAALTARRDALTTRRPFSNDAQPQNLTSFSLLLFFF